VLRCGGGGRLRFDVAAQGAAADAQVLGEFRAGTVVFTVGLEAPEALVADVRAFFRTVRGGTELPPVAR
jgi:hypothetical protein